MHIYGLISLNYIKPPYHDMNAAELTATTGSNFFISQPLLSKMYIHTLHTFVKFQNQEINLWHWHRVTSWQKQTGRDGILDDVQ